MKLSIIIPVYNVEPYLRRCLDSIIPQMDEECELILIDDGSHDKSGGICDKYAANDIRIKVKHQKNQGVSAARSNGLKIAIGEYVCFVDSDDYWDEGLLDKFRQNRKGDLIVFGYKSYPLIDSKDSHYFEHDNLFSQYELSDVILKMKRDYLLFPLINKFYKRRIIADNNIDFVKNIHYYEDLLFNLDYLKNVSELSTFAGCFYNYVQHPGERLGSKHTEPGTVVKISDMILQKSLKLELDNRNTIFDYCFYYNGLMHAIDESCKEKNTKTRKYIALLFSRISEYGYREELKQFVGRRKLYFLIHSKFWYRLILKLNHKMIKKEHV